jgi:hypothetical protein
MKIQYLPKFCGTFALSEILESAKHVFRSPRSPISSHLRVICKHKNYIFTKEFSIVHFEPRTIERPTRWCVVAPIAKLKTAKPNLDQDGRQFVKLFAAKVIHQT